MGFPKYIKEQILVDSARHCCVCHRYKGVKVEVHHIVQESLGGKNDYDNAIALCFDCHADAGHYNPHHPRGIKFSPGELHKAKEEWFNIVKNNKIIEPSKPDSLLCQYFVCESFEILHEICNGELREFPVNNPLLIKNNIFDSLCYLVSYHPHHTRHASAWGKTTENEEIYLKEHPDAILNKIIGDYNPYFKITRTPSIAELEKLKKTDGIVRLMLENDISPEKISQVAVYEGDGCDTIKLKEEFVFRKVWCIFVGFTNVSGEPLVLNTLETKDFSSGAFNKFTDATIENNSHPFPSMPITNGTTVLLPISIVFPPLYPLAREEWSYIHRETQSKSKRLQVMRHASIIVDNLNDVFCFRGKIIPKLVNYTRENHTETQEIHELDLANLYTINRYWECGSCPHLFFIGDTIKYQRELLAHCESKTGEEEIIIPPGLNAIIIAEIEDEITIINSIHIDGKLYKENIILNKNEKLVIPIKNDKCIKVKGSYIPNKMSDNLVFFGSIRNEYINQFIYDFKTGH